MKTKTIESIWTGSPTPYSDYVGAVIAGQLNPADVLNFIAGRTGQWAAWSDVLAHARAEREFCQSQGI